MNRILLITKYVNPIRKKEEYKRKEINKFAEHIAISKLLFHPDFWRENIICPGEKSFKAENLMAIDWSGEWDYHSRADLKSRIKLMMDRYDEKEKSHPLYEMQESPSMTQVCNVMGGGKRRRATKQKRRRATKQRRRRTTKQRKRRTTKQRRRTSRRVLSRRNRNRNRRR